MLLLFGARPTSAVIAAVVIYRAIELWVPAVIGSIAFLRPAPGDRRARRRGGDGLRVNA